jgi:hypothetical protein
MVFEYERVSELEDRLDAIPKIAVSPSKTLIELLPQDIDEKSLAAVLEKLSESERLLRENNFIVLRDFAVAATPEEVVINPQKIVDSLGIKKGSAEGIFPMIEKKLDAGKNEVNLEDLM